VVDAQLIDAENAIYRSLCMATLECKLVTLERRLGTIWGTLQDQCSLRAGPQASSTLDFRRLIGFQRRSMHTGTPEL